MTLRTLYTLAILLLVSGCAKYKVASSSDNERNIVPLSAVQEQPELIDQFPCADSKAVQTQCHEKKVQICHVPPGNPANAHTLCIGESAVKAHLAHHIADTGEEDSLGDCEGSPPPVDNGGT